MKIVLIQRGNILFAPAFPGIITTVDGDVKEHITKMVKDIIKNDLEPIDVDIKEVGQEGDQIITAEVAKVPSALAELLTSIFGEDAVEEVLGTQDTEKSEGEQIFQDVLNVMDRPTLMGMISGVNQLSDDDVYNLARRCVYTMESNIRQMDDTRISDRIGVLPVHFWVVLGACIFGDFDSMETLESEIPQDRFNKNMREAGGYWRLLRAGVVFLQNRAK